MKTSYLTVLSLVIITFFTLLSAGRVENGFFKIFLLILSSISTNFILANFFKIRIASFSESLSQVFIIFLITDPGSAIYLQIFAVILCLVINSFIKYEGREVFNNISLALFMISFLGLKMNWWGTNTNFLVIILVFILGIINVYVSKNVLPTLFFFVASFLINIVLTFNLLFALKQLFVPGFVFFACFLLFRNNALLDTLPKRRLYPLIASLSAITMPKLGVFTDPLITSLVFADLIFYGLRRARVSI